MLDIVGLDIMELDILGQWAEVLDIVGLDIMELDILGHMCGNLEPDCLPLVGSNIHLWM